MIDSRTFEVDKTLLKNILDNDPIAQNYVKKFSEIERTFGIGSCLAGGYIASKIGNFQSNDVDIFIYSENRKLSREMYDDISRSFFGSEKFVQKDLEENGYKHNDVDQIHESQSFPKIQLIYTKHANALDFDLTCCRQFYFTNGSVVTNPLFLGHRTDSFRKLNTIHRLGKYAIRGIPVYQHGEPLFLINHFFYSEWPFENHKPIQTNEFYVGLAISKFCYPDQEYNKLGAIDEARIKLVDLSKIKFFEHIPYKLV